MKRRLVYVLVGLLALGAAFYLNSGTESGDKADTSASASESNLSQNSKAPDADGGLGESASSPLASSDTTKGENNKPPLEVRSRDIKMGNTKIVTPGTQVTFHILAKIADGTIVFDSLKANRPWTGKVGDGSLLPGIDRGIRGMLMGGKRALWIPPDFAYGPNGIAGQIPPNANIYAEIELLEVF